VIQGVMVALVRKAEGRRQKAEGMKKEV
jgi:hypothetical protein